MPTIHEICQFLDEFAPPDLAEDWDNVGLLVGDREARVSHLMTCLTITPPSAAEAIESGAQLIVAHHPLPFHPLRRLTSDNVPGRLLLDLIRAGVAVYSPHTAFDSAQTGINQMLAERLGLTDIKPLVPSDSDSHDLGAGRFGRLATSESVADVARRLKELFALDGLHVVGPADRKVQTVAVACGSAGQFLGAARDAGCDALVTGETNFHTCLEAEATEVALLLPGHYASERFAVEHLAAVLADRFNDLEVWASRREADPLRWWSG